jgi:hypothetical protein
MATWRRDTTTYKPDVINFAVDFCKLMESPIVTHPLFKYIFKMIEKYTKTLHKCPFKKYEEITLTNFTIDYNLIPASLLLNEGRFRYDVTYYSTKLGERVIYYATQTFITVHKRYPHKKRTKNKKN